jgi:hypothetical protein
MKKIIVVNSKEGSVKVKNDIDSIEATSLTKVAEGLYRDIKYLFDDSKNLSAAEIKSFRTAIDGCAKCLDGLRSLK